MSQIKIDDKEYSVEAKHLTGEQILALAGKSYPDWSLELERDGKSTPISKEQQMDLGEVGDGVFRTKSDKAGRPDGGGKIRIKVDGTEYEVAESTMTGEQILALAGKSYSDWSLNEKLKSGRRVPIEKDQEVDLTDPELDRFETAPLQAQEGEAVRRCL